MVGNVNVKLRVVVSVNITDSYRIAPKFRSRKFL